MTLEDSLVLGR